MNNQAMQSQCKRMQKKNAIKAMQRNTDFSVETSEDIRITYYKEKKDRFKCTFKDRSFVTTLHVRSKNSEQENKK